MTFFYNYYERIQRMHNLLAPSHYIFYHLALQTENHNVNSLAIFIFYFGLGIFYFLTTNLYNDVKYCLI